MAKLRHEWTEAIEGSGKPESHEKEPEVDQDGVPTTRPVAEWLDLRDMGHVPDDRATRWLQAVLRFSRPDGSPVFSPHLRAKSLDRLKALEAWAERLGDPSLASVVARWLPARSGSKFLQSSPPLPSDARLDRSLAILRDDWASRGDLVAIDHRPIGDETLLEVASKGQVWLGPTWTSSPTDRKIGPSLPTHWTSANLAVCSEWSYKAGTGRVTRVAVLLRGRSMALLGQQDDGLESAAEARLTLPEGIEASRIKGSRVLQLSSGRGKPSARLIPLGLPAHDMATDRGSIAVEGREVVIRQATEGRRSWLPILITWEKAPITWRPLTVAYQSKACGSEVAVACRVAWGPHDEGLVVYRSLEPPELRCFLGHQTRARFLVGTFTRSGEVRPILKVDA